MRNLYGLGKRIERLLMLAGPLAFLCLLFLLISYANSSQLENKISQRLRFAADLIFENISELDTLYKPTKYGSKNQQQINKTIYRLRLKEIILFLAESNRVESVGGYSAYRDAISQRIEVLSEIGPRELASILVDESNKLKESKTHTLGIELPTKTKINFFGTEIGIETSAYLTLMQMSLAPILILWLGSIYVTRYREILLIRNSKHISDLFPHMINVYAIGKIADLRKRDFIKFYSRYLIFLLYFLIRIFFLLIFIGVPVSSYAIGCFLQFNIDSNIYPMLLGTLVAIISFSLIMIELFPFNFTKVFGDLDMKIGG